MTNIMQKIIKVLIILLMIQIIFAIGNISRVAAIKWDDIIEAGNNFIDSGKDELADGSITTTETEQGKVTIGAPDNEKLKQTINDISNIILLLGVAVTVIVGGVLGIKFMLASAEDKAKIKESLLPYVAGCVVIYGAFGIWKLAILVFSAI